VIFSHVLYQLSYLGKAAKAANRRRSSALIVSRSGPVQPLSASQPRRPEKGIAFPHNPLWLQCKSDLFDKRTSGKEVSSNTSPLWVETRAVIERSVYDDALDSGTHLRLSVLVFGQDGQRQKAYALLVEVTRLGE
jgi:hypothetical protein